MGVDEVLAGRAGLLWSLLELKRRRVSVDCDQFLATAVPKLADAIIREGEEAAREFEQRRRDNGEHFPLLWRWIDEYHSLGT
jgi:hypothetical protein